MIDIFPCTATCTRQHFPRLQQSTMRSQHAVQCNFSSIVRNGTTVHLKQVSTFKSQINTIKISKVHISLSPRENCASLILFPFILLVNGSVSALSEPRGRAYKEYMLRNRNGHPSSCAKQHHTHSLGRHSSVWLTPWGEPCRLRGSKLIKARE